MMMNKNYYLPPGYIRNVQNEGYCDNSTTLSFQPHIYELAARCLGADGVRTVIDLGCGSGRKLSHMPVGTRFKLYDIEPDEALIRSELPNARLDVHRCDFDLNFPSLADEDLLDAVVICADVIEHLRDPIRFMAKLAEVAQKCRYLFLSTPARDRARGCADSGPPANPAHCQEWSLDEFVLMARSVGLNVPFHGYTWNTDYHGWKSTVLIIDGNEAAATPKKLPKPPCAIVKSFNDKDFIAHCVTHLRNQGLSVYLLDNWSTDGTFEIARQLSDSDPAITVERFPNAPTAEYLWADILNRTVEVAESLGHGWYLHVDSDELRESPWRNLSLSDAIAHVDSCGYDAIDFTVIDFRYLEGEDVSGDPWNAMRYFEFGRRPGHFKQIKAWKYYGQPVDLSTSGGHEAVFEGRRVFPLKFLLRHFPLRGVEHANQKIFVERLPRSGQEKLERGWHVQYDGISNARLNGWKRHELIAWHPNTFQTEYLVERLSGIGLLE